MFKVSHPAIMQQKAGVTGCRVFSESMFWTFKKKTLSHSQAAAAGCSHNSRMDISHLRCFYDFSFHFKVLKLMKSRWNLSQPGKQDIERHNLWPKQGSKGRIIKNWQNVFQKNMWIWNIFPFGLFCWNNEKTILFGLYFIQFSVSHYFYLSGSSAPVGGWFLKEKKKVKRLNSHVPACTGQKFYLLASRFF